MVTAFTDTLMMIRPANFGYNEETAVNNAFQLKPGEEADSVRQKALREFDGFVSIIRESGIRVIVIEDREDPVCPDAVFPNNWISFHEDGKIITYPMFAPNRRNERREDMILQMKKDLKFDIHLDWSKYETKGQILEGTGSMVFDREHKVCYACLSPRTDRQLLEEFGKEFGYETLAFLAEDDQGQEIYHTNVMMGLGNGYVVICLESITRAEERSQVVHRIRSSGKEIIEISFGQMNDFAGNMLHVKSVHGRDHIVCSSRAYHTLGTGQREAIEQYAVFVHAPLDTIETIGGGSARCMLAEVYYP